MPQRSPSFQPPHSFRQAACLQTSPGKLPLPAAKAYLGLHPLHRGTQIPRDPPDSWRTTLRVSSRVVEIFISLVELGQAEGSGARED